MDITILVLLLLGGASGNYFSLNLSLGVDFLFGGIAVWLVVILYGTYWGTLAGLITSLVTIRLWGHPYAVIIFTLEALFVASLRHSRRRNLLLLDGIYWLCLGMPLIGLFYAGVMQLSPLQVGLILLKQPINGIFNFLIANLIVFFLPIHYWTRRSRQFPAVSFRQILFNLLFVLAIIPLLPLISLKGHLAFEQLKNRVDRDLTAISTAVKTEMHREWHERLADLQELARVAQTSGLQQSAQLQQSTEIFQKNQPVWQQLYVTNSEGEIIASSPPLDTSNGANAIEPTACNLKEQFTFVSATGILQIKFPVFIVGESSQGCIVGGIDQNYLRQLLLANRSQPELRFSLADSGGRVVVSTDKPKEEIAPQTDSTPINNSFFNSTIEHRLPIAKNMPLMARWQHSSFLQRQSLGDNFPLTLLIETPAAPYINFLQEMYVLALIKILLIAGLAWFVSHLLSRQLVNPLSCLGIVTSDLPHKLSENKHVAWPRSRIAEVESLAYNFQLMAEILQEKFQELQTINTTLEQQIENRTQELFKTNQDLQAEIAERKQTETSLRETTRKLEKFSSNLQQLHRISTTQYDTWEELFADCLETGRDILALKTGMIGQISDRSYIICSVLSDLTCFKPGLAFSLEEAYCKAVVESQKTITYDRVGAIASMQNHPLYQQLKIESYISSPIFVNGKVYGTLCFCSTQVRNSKFDEHEREMVELMAKTIGWYIANDRAQEKLRNQYQRSQLLSEVALKIRQSLQLEEILETTVTEVQKLLQSQRVAIVHCGSDGTGKVVREAVVSGFPSLIERSISELVFAATYLEEFRQGRFVAVNENLIEAKAATIESNKKQLLEFGVQASLGVPIFIANQFWGLLLLQHCSNPRQWNDFEIELSQQLADQIGIAISQSQLLQNLEELVRERTIELSQTNERLQRELIERQLVEKALRESKTRLVMTQRVARIGSWEFDLESQKIAWSEETFHHLGLAPTDSEPTYAELLQKVHPDDREMLQQSVEKAIAEGIPYTLDLRILRSDGSIGYLDSRAKPILNDRGQTVKLIGTSVDITERKRMEEALRQREERLRLITDSLPVCIAYIDRDRRYRFANKTYETWFGYRPEEIYGKQVVEVIGEAAYEIAKDKIERALSGELLTYEAELPYRQGSIRYVNAILIPDISSNEEVRGYYALIADISDRKRAEQALRRSEQQLRSIADALPILIAYVDSQQRYLFTNRAYEKWFGRNPGELKGLSVQTVMGFSVYQQVREYIEIVLSGQRVDFELEVPALDGNYHYLSVTYIPHTIEHRGVKGFFASLVDITERKAVERMKEEFLSVVSHELRTPLTAIHGSLKLLATGMLGQLSEQGLQMLEIADESCDRLVRLINDILDFQRMNSGRVTLRQQNYDAAELVAKAVEAMQGMARQQNITLATEPISISVWLDPDYILQTLTNLIGNAIKFSNPGTTVWLQVSAQGDRVLFQVRDEGRGIPPDKLESIFERFHQVDASDSRQKGGTGLGLAICRQIIELHGGKIWAESTLGQGSTFYFTLPRIN
jgi:PAS domain S-box-containing protein